MNITNETRSSTFAQDFIREHLILLAKQAAQAGLSLDVFQSLLIAQAEDIDFQPFFKSKESEF